MIEELLKKRGHSDPEKGAETVKMQDPFERRRMIYKNPDAVMDLIEAFRTDSEKAMRDGMQAANERMMNVFDFTSEFKPLIQRAMNDLRSGKEGSITQIADIHFKMDSFFADKGGGTGFSDIFPNVDKVVEKYLGETYYPDDFRGL